SQRLTSQTLVDSRDSIYTIYCIGGSTTFGFFIPDDQTYPSHLSKLLRDEGYDNFEVKNLGVTSYNPFQETDLFEELLFIGNRPSLVIFLDGYNLGELHSGGAYS